MPIRENFNYRHPIAPRIVELGEMEGCAVPDNQVLGIAQIVQRGGASYDLEDRRAMLDGYRKFLDRWGFRTAFPTVENLFSALGRKCYDSWQQYMENARICDAVDIAAISGWESTAIDNHSGIVDNLRNFKGDPSSLSAALSPLRPVAKQRSLTVASGQRAIFDLYLLNDTGTSAGGTLAFAMTDPAGQTIKLGVFPTPRFQPEQFSKLVKANLVTPPLTREGLYRFAFSLSGALQVTHRRDIFVANTSLPPVAGRDVADRRRRHLARPAQAAGRDSGLAVEDFALGETYAAIIGSGLTERSTSAQKLGGDAGLTLQKSTGSTPTPGELPVTAIAAVKAGTPLLVMAQEDGLADGVARQLAGEGAFTYDSQVGRLRAPWMGNWYFLREHPVYDGMPSNQAMGLYLQTHGRQANGLVVDGPDVDVFVGYGRDHDPPRRRRHLHDAARRREGPVPACARFRRADAAALPAQRTRLALRLTFEWDIAQHGVGQECGLLAALSRHACEAPQADPACSLRSFASTRRPPGRSDSTAWPAMTWPCATAKRSCGCAPPAASDRAAPGSASPSPIVRTAMSPCPSNSGCSIL
ncbi:MAG: hypothetical protein WDM81_08870 [Rhizomicrobium sp.]